MVAKTTSGRQYLSTLLLDRVGDLPGRVWLLQLRLITPRSGMALIPRGHARFAVIVLILSESQWWLIVCHANTDTVLRLLIKELGLIIELYFHYVCVTIAYFMTMSFIIVRPIFVYYFFLSSVVNRNAVCIPSVTFSRPILRRLLDTVIDETCSIYFYFRSFGSFSLLHFYITSSFPSLLFGLLILYFGPHFRWCSSRVSCLNCLEPASRHFFSLSCLCPASATVCLGLDGNAGEIDKAGNGYTAPLRRRRRTCHVMYEPIQ